MVICYISARKLVHWSNKDVSKKEYVILTGKKERYHAWMHNYRNGFKHHLLLNCQVKSVDQHIEAQHLPLGTWDW